jgi:branched-chain amino acid transport system ATP-binding protein
VVSRVNDLLILDHVTIRFGGLCAVDDVSIRIGAQERRAIIGPNGAGKTTLFNAITGVIRPTSGKVIFQDQDITNTPIHARTKQGISRTFQITNLFPNLTVQENMQLAAYGLSPRKFSILGKIVLDANARAHADAALTFSRLQERVHTPVKELSYGEQRQLELAMALTAQPKLLLLDEPAAGLSPPERVILADIIAALPRSLPIVLIDHDMDLVLQLVDYVTVLNNGKLLAQAPPQQIRENVDVQNVYFGKARQHA